jgi:uncharacterized protein YdaU (DUF1376 family)
MNYYKRHIGDYMKDASHLSLLEHGVYMRLLDVYYTRESAIPVEQAARLVGARSKDEKEALTMVAGEFFRAVDGFYTQTRCDLEISAQQQKAETNREVGKRGGRPKKASSAVEFPNPEITPTDYQNNPDETLATSHKPVTSSQEEGAPADQPPSVPDGPVRPSMAGAVCVAMKAAGLASVNPSHPDLLVLLNKGADIGLFVAVAQECVARQKTFAYALAMVKGRMADAAVLSGMALAAPPQHTGQVNKQEALEQRNRQVAQAWAAGEGA